MIRVHAFNLTSTGIAYALRIAGYSTMAEVYSLLAHGTPCWKEQGK